MVGGCEAINAQFGRNVRRMRSLAGLSRADVGRRLGVSFRQIQKYEGGHDNVSVATLCRLTAILGCGSADLLAGLPGVAAAEGAGGGAEAKRRDDRAYRLSRAVMAIRDADVQGRLIRLARALADGAS